MNKEQENQFKENIKEIARLELKNSFTDNLMETLNSAFIFKYVNTLEKQNQKYKEVIDKAIKCIDYNTKYRNGADIYQFVDIESEILEPLKFILKFDEENGNAYLKEFNDWLKEEVSKFQEQLKEVSE